MSVQGKWRIVEMADYEADFPDMVEPAYILFGKTGGEFAFGCVTGVIYGTCEGDAVEFTWDGNDEMDQASGHGWADLQDDGSLEGEICFHNGDEVTIIARPLEHFFNSLLKVFRDTEYAALREHARNRATAKERLREEETRTTDMFAAHNIDAQEATLDDLVEEQKLQAKDMLIALLKQNGPTQFGRLVSELLQIYILRETNVKDICVDLAKAGTIENTWGGGNRKPRDTDLIRLNTSKT